VVKGSCIDTFFQKVIVDSPKNLIISGPNPICSGTENTFTVNKFDSGTYVWTPTNLLTYSNRDTAKFLIQNATTISVTYTSKAGCVSNKSLPLTLITASIKLSGDSIACKNESLSYTATANVSGGIFTFSPSNIITNVIGNTATYNIDTTRFIKVTYTNGGCKAEDSIKVSLLKDALNWKVDSLICKNTPLTATAIKNPIYNLVWSPSSILTSGQGNSPATFNLNNTSQKIYIEATHNTRSTCKIKDSALIKFLEDELKLTADQTRCKDSGVSITATNLPNVNYQWTPASLLISQTNNIANFKTTQSQFYKVKAIDNSGCSVSDSIFITIINDLIIATATSDSVCKNSTVDLLVTQMQNATYQWFPAIDITQGANSNNAKAIVKNTQWFYVQIIDTNGCFLKDSVFVKIKDSSNYIQAYFTNNIVCLGDSLLFFNGTKNSTNNTIYKWDFGGGITTNLKNPKSLILTKGANLVTLIASDTSKCNLSDTFKSNTFVMANNRDTLPTFKSCKNDSVTIGISNLVDTIAKIVWNPGGMTTFNPKIKVSQNTTFIGLLTKNSCTDTFVQLVLVDTIKPLKILGEKDACLFMTRSFTSTKYDSGQYVWNPQNALIKNNRDSASFYISIAPFKVQLNYISEFGCISKDSFDINFVSPSLNITGDSIACKDEKLLFKGTFNPKDGVLSWVPNSWVLSNTDTSAIIKIDTSTNIIGNYFINLRCQISDTIPLKLLKDKVNWAVDSFICYNNNIIATANTSSLWSLNWQPNANLISGQNSSPAIFNFNKVDNSVKIKATLLSRPSCTFDDSARIRYIENYLKLTADQTRCKDSGVTIFAPSISNAIYNWSPQNLILSQKDTQATFITDKSRFYYLELVDNSGCTVRDSIFITVINDLMKVRADSIICINDTVSLKATPMTGANYTWTPAPLIVNGVGATALAKLQKGATIYVQVVDTNNCQLMDSVFVNVLDKNTFFIKTTDTLNCKFDSIEIETSHLPNIQFNWTPTAPITSGIGTGKIKGFINANTLFIVTASLSRGCSISDSLFIKKDSNFVKLTANPIVCRLDTFTIKATANPNYKYSWNPPNWVENRDTLVRYVMLDKFQYRCDITVAPANKCKYFDTITVDYSRLLEDLEAIATPARIEFGDSSRLLAKTQNGADFVWSPKETLDKYLVPSPWAKPKVNTIYEVIVKDRYGCRKSDTAEVEVYYEICDDPEVYVPNAFTPNSDGKNDALYVRGDNIVKLYFAVYDRWGQLIFETNTQKKGWDGTYKGVLLEPSVYAYYLDVLCIGGAQLKKSGNITLLK
jgi:gliding motility-associated-like protein